MSYDERFKALLTEFFQNFLELFFPEMAQQIDWSKKPEFLDKELPSVMKASPKAVDLLTKVWSLEPPRSSSPQRLCLIHVEVESRKSRESLGRRVARYVTQIDEKFGLPVVPVAVFIHVGGDGIGWQTWDMTCWNYTIQSTRFPYIGLPALDGVQYSATQNPIAWALSGLMNVPPSERARSQMRIGTEDRTSQAGSKTQTTLARIGPHFHGARSGTAANLRSSVEVTAVSEGERNAKDDVRHGPRNGCV